MKADLHCHSYYSDGKHGPEFLLQQAYDNGVSHLALTDHDCVDGLLQSHCMPGVTLVNGVEISCDWEHREIHVVGLCIDPRQETLQKLLANQQQRRHQRLQAIDHRLKRIDIGGLLDYMSLLPCVAPTRTHVADFLLDRKICKSHKQAFKKYLGRQGRAWVPGEWCGLGDAVATIRAVGGIAILAHPGRYGLSRRRLSSLVDAFGEAGGEGLETCYPNLQNTEQKFLEDLALERTLYASTGSDFHSSAARWTAIGKFPGLGERCKKNAIWEHPKWRSSVASAPSS